jgi:hypothetical protein
VPVVINEVEILEPARAAQAATAAPTAPQQEPAYEQLRRFLADERRRQTRLAAD